MLRLAARCRSCPRLTSARFKAARRFRPNYYPGVCSIYVDVRTPPELAAGAGAARALRAAARPSSGSNMRIEMHASKMGYEAKSAGSVIKVLEENYQSLFGKRLRHRPAFTPASGRIPIFITRWASRPASSVSAAVRWKFRSEQIDDREISIRRRRFMHAAALKSVTVEKKPRVEECQAVPHGQRFEFNWRDDRSNANSTPNSLGSARRRWLTESFKANFAWQFDRRNLSI